jgi:hypothetical protein
MTPWRSTADRKPPTPATFEGSPARRGIAMPRAVSQDDGDGRVMVVMILLAGIIRPVQTIVRREPWGAGAMLGLIITLCAARALLIQALLRWADRRRQRRVGSSP